MEKWSAVLMFCNYSYVALSHKKGNTRPMEIVDKEMQFQTDPIVLPNGNFFVIVGGNNSGKSTLLRTIVKNQGKDLSYLVNVNRTRLTGEGAARKDYQNEYVGRLNRVMNEFDDNYERATEPLQDFFNLKDKDREPILEWYNKYFPNPIIEEREDPENQASAMFLKINGFPITKQGSGVRATLEIFIKLFDPNIKILCIDEPELGLEPYLQKYLFSALKEKSSSDKKIILATHSHHFLDFENIDSNFVCQIYSENKIYLTQVDDFKPVIFRLLGNTLSSFLLPENVLVLEGSSDTTFINKCLALLLKKGVAVHNSGGNGNISYAVNSITQFLTFHSNELPVYKNNVFVLADKPIKDIVVRQWETLLGDKTRLKVLAKDAIEYYYPEHILQEIFSTKDSREKIVAEYLKNNPNGFNNKQIPKTTLAKLVIEKITLADLNDTNNELFVFLKTLP
jgi:predicted ATPase